MRLVSASNMKLKQVGEHILREEPHDHDLLPVVTIEPHLQRIVMVFPAFARTNAVLIHHAGLQVRDAAAS